MKDLARWWLPALASLALLGACGADEHAAKPAAAASTGASPPAEAETVRFLQRHWDRPLAPQGPLPASMAAQGISLAPQSCAACHAAQYEDWRRSLHSRSMDPGVLGQLLNMPAHARDDHQSCLRCHAPLAEQADSLVAALEALEQRSPNKVAVAGKAVPLHEQGLVCTGCHVRKLQWYGPARRDGSAPAAGNTSTSPHGGWRASGAFESSRFCAACHQFDDNGFALKGKLLENTYAEWKDSRYAREGLSCQSCHMPDRRHLWRGIHDPEMVRRGVTMVAESATIVKGVLVSRLGVTNSGVGHFFPTYVTPRVVVRGFQQNAAGRKLGGTEQQFVIGRQVSQDLSREIADTRIAPDATAAFDYRGPRHDSAVALVWEVEVQPDAFYLELYEGLLRDAPEGNSRSLIAQARDAAAASPFQVFSRQLALP